MTPRIVVAGDSALCVEWDERIDLDINAQVLALAERLQARALPGVRDLVPVYSTLAIYFDPMVADAGGLSLLVRHEMEVATPRPWTEARLIEVPVCYDVEFGPDLESLAARAGLDRVEAVARHTARDYHVYMLGFTPGFAYMGTVDASLAAPRLSTPRARVPAGSVGIAGNQTGIYPSDTPGGWNLIGRTPLRCWTPEAEQPTLFRPGDRVRFTAIDRREFDRLATSEAL